MIKNLPRMAALLIFVYCAGIALPAARAQTPPTADEARAIAKDAYIWGYPVVANYQSLYKQAVDTNDRDYRAPFNSLARTSSVATADDTFVPMPNADTPFSYLWMDLRAEPMIITLPKIDKGRYYTAQLVDLYTFDFAYFGSRNYSNNGGVFLIAGPGWKGDKPKGVTEVFHCETQFAFAFFRTQLFNPAEIAKVEDIQRGYTAQELSKFLHQSAPADPPEFTWMNPMADMTTTPVFFRYLNFMLQFCPPNAADKAMLDRFAKLNIGAGKNFDFSKFPPDVQTAILAGIADAQQDIAGAVQKVNADQIFSGALYGTRETLKDNYLYRAAGAKLGLYGNVVDEELDFVYSTDGSGKPLDAAATNYTLHFDKGKLPNARAFWSLTMYDGKTQLFVANPLNRYLINSTMQKGFKYDADGGLTLYIQKNSPGGQQDGNWLPAPSGPFLCVLRIYMPGDDMQNGSWKRPPMQPAGAK